MINVYKAHAGRWKRAVRRFALDIWRNRADEKAVSRYENQAELFSKEYRNSLEKHYREKGLHVFRGTIDGKVADWLEHQFALEDTLRDMAKTKKEKLVAEEIERLNSDKERDVQDSLRKIYDLRDDEKVYKVFSFAQNFEGQAGQIGDNQAYDLGTAINEAILRENSDRYFWRVQKDSKVSVLHLMLADICFLFDDPPTTIDKYGNKLTGNPGVIRHGCRCWADPAPIREKAKRNYVVREK